MGTPAGCIAWGNALLVACAVFYLAWWTAFFAPSVPKPHGAFYAASAGCIVVAGLAGIAGVLVGSYGIAELSPLSAKALPVWAVVLSGVVLYVVLLLVTKNALHRPVTTELVLFCAWLTFELCALHVLAGAGVLPDATAYTLLAAVVVVFAACLVCYVLYYNLDAWPSFLDGAIPLVLVGAVSCVVALLLK